MKNEAHNKETEMSKAMETATQIIDSLTGYARNEARAWEKADTCRIYFGRKYITITQDGAVDYDTSDSPYGVLELVRDEMDVTVVNAPSYWA